MDTGEKNYNNLPARAMKLLPREKKTLVFFPFLSTDRKKPKFMVAVLCSLSRLHCLNVLALQISGSDSVLLV